MEKEFIHDRNTHQHGENCSHNHSHDYKIDERTYDQMDRPKINIQLYINIYLFIQLPIVFLCQQFQENLIDEDKKYNFEENLEKVPNPLKSGFFLGNLIKIFVLNFCDVLVIMYLFKPLSKPNREV